MIKGIWQNVGFYLPPARSNVRVKDSIDGPVYIARWNGDSGWQVISYSQDIGASVGKPLFWLNFN